EDLAASPPDREVSAPSDREFGQGPCPAVSSVDPAQNQGNRGSAQLARPTVAGNQIIRKLMSSAGARPCRVTPDTSTRAGDPARNTRKIEHEHESLRTAMGCAQPYSAIAASGFGAPGSFESPAFCGRFRVSSRLAEFPVRGSERRPRVCHLHLWLHG